MIQKCSKWVVLKEFLDEPMKKKQIREISRDIKLATTSVKLHIKRLMENKLVIEKNDDIFKYYIANFDNEQFRFYKKINTLFKLYESGLIDHLNDLCSPDAIILFGSCSKGEDTGESDIDLYLQAKEKNLDIGRYEKLMKRKIQLFFAEDFNKLPKELRNNIINGVKLDGYLKVF